MHLALAQMPDGRGEQEPQPGTVYLGVQPVEFFRLGQILQRFLERTSLLRRFHQMEQRLNVLWMGLSPVLGHVVGHLPWTMLLRPGQPQMEGFGAGIGLAGAQVQHPRRRNILRLLLLAGLAVERLPVAHLLDDFRRNVLGDLRHVQRENSILQATGCKPVLLDGLAAKVRPDRSRFRVAIYIVLVFQ